MPVLREDRRAVGPAYVDKDVYKRMQRVSRKDWRLSMSKQLGEAITKGTTIDDFEKIVGIKKFAKRT